MVLRSSESKNERSAEARRKLKRQGNRSLGAAMYSKLSSLLMLSLATCYEAISKLESLLYIIMLSQAVITIRRAAAADAELLSALGTTTFHSAFATDNNPEDMAAY